MSVAGSAEDPAITGEDDAHASRLENVLIGDSMNVLLKTLVAKKHTWFHKSIK